MSGCCRTLQHGLPLPFAIHLHVRRGSMTWEYNRSLLIQFSAEFIKPELQSHPTLFQPFQPHSISAAAAVLQTSTDRVSCFQIHAQALPFFNVPLSRSITAFLSTIAFSEMGRVSSPTPTMVGPSLPWQGRTTASSRPTRG